MQSQLFGSQQHEQRDRAQHWSHDGRLESGNNNRQNITNLIGEKLRSNVKMSALGNRRNSSEDDSLTGIILLCLVVEKFHRSFYKIFN